MDLIIFMGATIVKILSKDTKEENNLREQYSEVVQRILQHAEKICKELGDIEYKGKKVRLAKYIEHPKPLLQK